MKKISTLSFLVFIPLFLLSCTSNSAQREFEKEAYLVAQNISETNNQGSVVSVDSDDWRTAPLFQGLIEIRPPFPNPVAVTSSLTFELEVTGVQSVSGLEVVVRYSNDTFGSIYFHPQSPLQPGLSSFQINPQEFGEFGTVESARGVHRIFIFDRNNRLISYGDIEVE